jgi:hypothetical protein
MSQPVPAAAKVVLPAGLSVRLAQLLSSCCVSVDCTPVQMLHPAGLAAPGWHSHKKQAWVGARANFRDADGEQVRRIVAFQAPRENDLDELGSKPCSFKSLCRAERA